MRLVIRLLVAAALFALIVLPVAATGTDEVADAEEPVTIEIMDRSNNFSEEQGEQFMELYPNIELILDRGDEEKLFARMASGDPPHLRLNASSRIPQFVNDGWLLALDDYVDESDRISWDDLFFVEEAWRYNPDTQTHLEGPMWGLTKDWNITRAYFYRKDIFEAAGIGEIDPTAAMTYDEFFDEILSKLLVREDGATTRWALDGVLLGNPEISIRNMLATAGEDIYTDELDGVEIVSNPEAMGALRYMVDLAKNHYYPSEIDPAPTWGVPLLANLEESPLGVYQFGYWAVANLADVNMDAMDQIGYAIGPVWSTEVDVQQVPPVVGYSILADHPQEELDAAWIAMEEMIVGFIGQARAKIGWGIPATRSMFELLPESNDLFAQVKSVTEWQLENQNLENAKLNPYAAVPFRLGFRKYLAEYLQDEMTFEEFAQAVEDETNALISERM